MDVKPDLHFGDIIADHRDAELMMFIGKDQHWVEVLQLKDPDGRVPDNQWQATPRPVESFVGGGYYKVDEDE